MRNIQDILRCIDAVPPDRRRHLSYCGVNLAAGFLKGRDLSHIDWEWADFTDADLSGASLRFCRLPNTRFSGASLQGADLTGADLTGANLRYCNLTGAHLEGANLFQANLEFACLDGVTSDEPPSSFHLYCPEPGPLLGYKKCCDYRLAQLLIPADARRSSATGRSCRCSRAKVLTIKSFDYTAQFDEAWSLVDPEFVYRVGQWVEVDNFNEDRWMDSTTGIHFWLTREEARQY